MVAIMQALAMPCSALPSDSSTLDASISACQSSISALDSSIKTLGDKSSPWEFLAIVCSFAVFVGIIGEVVVIVSEYRDDLDGWKQGVIFWVWRAVLPPERPPRWRFWFDISATVVVLLGILGEAGASARLAFINSQLRSDTNKLSAYSDQLLALVTWEAGNAVTSVGVVEKKAESLNRQIGTTSKETASLERQFPAVKAQIAALGSSATDAIERAKRLEAELSWRTVTPAQKKAIRASLSRLGLLPLRNWKLAFVSPLGCSECEEYAEELKAALDDLGGTISGPNGGGYIRPPRGVILTINPADILERIPSVLLNDLQANGISATGSNDPSVPKGTIDIAVGIKPDEASP